MDYTWIFIWLGTILATANAENIGYEYLKDSMIHDLSEADVIGIQQDAFQRVVGSLQWFQSEVCEWIFISILTVLFILKYVCIF